MSRCIDSPHHIACLLSIKYFSKAHRSWFVSYCTPQGSAYDRYLLFFSQPRRFPSLPPCPLPEAGQRSGSSTWMTFKRFLRLCSQNARPYPHQRTSTSTGTLCPRTPWGSRASTRSLLTSKNLNRPAGTNLDVEENKELHIKVCTLPRKNMNLPYSIRMYWTYFWPRAMFKDVKRSFVVDFFWSFMTFSCRFHGLFIVYFGKLSILLGLYRFFSRS